MKMRLTCPSKTFLMGEYAVLDYGSALLVNTEPQFQLLVDMQGKGRVQGIHPSSPAGQWLRQNKLPVQKLDVVFNDPHEGRGGFGASSAQFLLVHILTQILKSPDKDEDFAVDSIHRAFRQLGARKEGVPPSGADLISQYIGGLCEVDIGENAHQRWRWPFSDYNLAIIPTGKKLSTHEHLSRYQAFSTTELNWIYNQSMEAIEAGDETTFISAVNDYHSELMDLGLVAAHSVELIEQLMSLPFVHAAKGCGAMGSDAVLAIVRDESFPELVNRLKKIGLNVLADLTQVSEGFHIETDVDVTLIPDGETWV